MHTLIPSANVILDSLKKKKKKGQGELTSPEIQTLILNLVSKFPRISTGPAVRVFNGPGDLNPRSSLHKSPRLIILLTTEINVIISKKNHPALISLLGGFQSGQFEFTFMFIFKQTRYVHLTVVCNL